MFDELKRHFNTEQIVDLTATIALENMRARFNRALQIESDSFCRLPAHHPALGVGSVALISGNFQKTIAWRGGRNIEPSRW